MKYRLIGLGLLALALPAIAQVNVPFTVLAQTQSGNGPDVAHQEVIRTPGGMSLVDTWLSTPAPLIEWGREAVVLVSLGTQSSGGFSVEVTGVVRHPMSGGVSRYEVQVRETRPTGPAIQIPTQPYQIVKIPARPQDPVVFVAAPAPSPPGPVNFREIDLAVTAHMLSGPPSTRRIRVNGDGRVEVWLDDGSGSTLNVDGRVTLQELTALSRAVTRARLNSIPATIPTVSSPPFPSFQGSPWTLNVSSATAALDGRTRGSEIGLYASFQARLDPLIEATQRVLDRVLLGAPPPPSTTSGEIVVQGSLVLLRTPSGQELRILPQATANSLRKFHGFYGEFEGTVGGVPVPGGPEVLEVDRVVRPEFRAAVSGAVYADADGKPVLSMGSGSPALQVVGPLRQLLEGAIGREVEVDAYFLGSASVPTGVYVGAVKATARYTTRVYPSLWSSRLQRNRSAWVERVSRSGRYALIRRGTTRAGWVRTRALRVGQPLPSIQPVVQPLAGSASAADSAPTTGLVGELQND